MLLDASAALHIDLSRSYFVGDHSRDMEAGRRAGVKTILLQTTYNTFCHGCGDFNFNAISEIEDFIRSLSNDFLLPSP
jgi:D-glycero-D-manno-heptose 1,7-bisphosphate phosphatase